MALNHNHNLKNLSWHTSGSLVGLFDESEDDSLSPATWLVGSVRVESRDTMEHVASSAQFSNPFYFRSHVAPFCHLDTHNVRLIVPT